MADPLSITSGILAVLQLASRVVQYLNAVREASNDKQRLVAEIGSVTGFLYLLKDSVTAKGPSATLVSKGWRFSFVVDRIASKMSVLRSAIYALNVLSNRNFISPKWNDIRWPCSTDSWLCLAFYMFT